jgi:hypothetical protein
MWDPILVANDVPALKDEPAIRRRMVYRKFNKCFDPKQVAERQAKDPDVVYDEAQWTDSELNRLVHSEEWRRRSR